MTDYSETLHRNVKREWALAFKSALIIGLAAHLYKFTNTLPNHDALFSVHTDMNIIGSGRWFLAVACAPSSFYDLPWLTGLLSLIYIGVAAAIIADIFRMKTGHCIILTAGLLVSFPCITNTFFFEFTADGYMLAMILAALAVRFSMVGDNKVTHLITSAVCICLSCGIYQAYVSFALLLALAHFMWELLENRMGKKEYLRWILNQIIIYAAGLAAYLVIWKLCMHFEHETVSSYIGMDTLDTAVINGAFILNAIKKTAVTLAQFFLSRNVFSYGWTWYAVLNVLFLILAAASFIAAAVKTKLIKRPLHLILVILCLIAAPFFCCIWYFISENVEYHLLMLQSLSIIYIFALLCTQKYFKGGVRAVSAVFFAMLIFKFCMQANASYFEMDKCCARTEAMAAEICTRVHEMDEGNVEKIAIVGGGDCSLGAINDPSTAEITINAHQIRNNLIFDNSYGYAYLIHFTDIGYEPVDSETLGALENDPRVSEMPEWPLRGSVSIIDDTAVIKLPVVEPTY